MTVAAARLNKPVELQSLIASYDRGERTVEWQTIAKPIWASITPISGLETINAEADGAKITHKISVRWHPEITNQSRFIYDSGRDGRTRVFNAVSVLNVMEAEESLEVLCEEKADVKSQY